MKFRFIGDPNNGFDGPDEISLFDLTFRRDSWTDVPPHIADRLSRNGHFERQPHLMAALQPKPAAPEKPVSGFLAFLRRWG